MKPFRLPAALAISVVMVLAAAGQSESRSAVAQSPACEFRLGFKALHDLIQDIVSDCVENERHNLENGDGLQRTTRGLLVWRKADSWTAFTDGTTTWINGPLGLQSRPNGERFAWEGGPAVGESGIEGQVLIGPTCPVVRDPGPECDDQPYQATITVTDQQRQGVTRFRTGPDGRFRVPLAPGNYVLYPEPPGRLPRASEQLVTVRPGQFTLVLIRYDSGIR